MRRRAYLFPMRWAMPNAVAISISRGLLAGDIALPVRGYRCPLRLEKFRVGKCRWKKLAPGLGLEPRFQAPKARVLPIAPPRSGERKCSPSSVANLSHACSPSAPLWFRARDSYTYPAANLNNFEVLSGRVPGRAKLQGRDESASLWRDAVPAYPGLAHHRRDYR